MPADPQDFAYFHRTESPPFNRGTGGTGGFDYFSAGEAFPAAIPADGAVTHNAAATLSGAGDLSAAATRTAIVAAVLSGTGDLTAAATRTAVAAGALDGAGGLSCVATVASPVAAPARPVELVVGGVGVHHDLKALRLVSVAARCDTSWQTAAPVWQTVAARGDTEWFRAGGTVVAKRGDTEYQAHDPDEHELLLYLMAAR